MSVKVNKTHLEITDMPTDNLQALGKLRTVLVGTFNKAREHKHRMTLLKTVLKFMYNKCTEFEKARDGEVAEAVKEEVKVKTATTEETKETTVQKEAK